MYRIEGVIEGVAPILFGAFGDTDSIDGPTTGGGGRTRTKEQIDLEVAQKVYRMTDGTLGLPGWNFKRCLLDGCKRAGLKEGRGSMAPYLEATVFAAGELSFGVTEWDFVHKAPGRRPPKTGGALLIRRPALKPGWRLAFALTVVDERRSPEAIRRSMEEAGLMVGLGPWRPEYGRFIVAEWSGKLAIA